MATRKTPTANAPKRRLQTRSSEQSNGPLSYPTSDQVRTRAYELYLERGGAHGYDLDDWFAAEHELNITIARSA